MDFVEQEEFDAIVTATEKRRAAYAEARAKYAKPDHAESLLDVIARKRALNHALGVADAELEAAWASR
jgi:hypothetical protein